MHFRNAILLVLLASAIGFAGAVSSNIDLNASPSNYYTQSSSNLTFSFNFTNLRDDDSTIDRVDLYLLDLKANGIDFMVYNGTGWQHEYIAKFDDDHFWITNASGQLLSVTLKPNFSSEGTYPLQAYYQFFDQTGTMVGLGDNRPLLPLGDFVDHVFANVIIDKTSPSVSFYGQPSWTSSGLKIDANVSDASPINAVTLEYNSPAGQKIINAQYSAQSKSATATISLADIVEGTTLQVILNAVDAAGNKGSASKDIPVVDNPLITLVHPDTLLPQTPIKLLAKITDSSGVASAKVSLLVVSKDPQSTSVAEFPMVKGEQDVWSVNLGSFEKGTKIDYTINAKDKLDNSSTFLDSFTVFNEYNVKFNVVDAILKTPLNNVSLTVSQRTVSTSGTNFVIPEKSMTFDGSKEFLQLEGPYYFTFTNPAYPEHKYLFDIVSDFEKTILLGSGAQSQIELAEVKPRMSDDNKSFFLDVSARVREAYPVKSMRLVYSVNSDGYSSSIDFLPKGGSEYALVLGPFQDQIVLYSRIELVDASEQVVVQDLGIRWYSLLSALQGVMPEICGNSKDDNNNGLVDEGCPCTEDSTQTCSKNVGICKPGKQKCLGGKWSETCDGGISPISEACGNELDDDCDGTVDNGCFVDSDNDGLSDDREKKLGTDPRNPDSDGDNVLDGQEVLEDDTNPLDPESNLLYLDLKAQVQLGEMQEIRVLHPKLGSIKNAEALVISPSGQQARYSANEEGAIIFKPAEEGQYSAKVSKEKFSKAREFSVSSGVFSVVSGVSGSVNYFFGESGSEFPLLPLVVLLLCALLGFLANHLLYPLLKPKKILSSSEERTEFLKRAALIVAAAIVPFIAFRASGIGPAVVATVALAIAFFAANFISAKAVGGRKAVRVGSEKMASGNILEKLVSSVKGVFVEEKSSPEIRPSKDWKKVDWDFTQEEKAASSSAAAQRKEGQGTPEVVPIVSGGNEKDFDFITPETAASYPAEERGSPDSAQGSSTKSVEVWKRFEPVEFEDRMTEIGKEVEKSLEKKLLEVGEEIEGRVGKKLAEVEEEVDRRVSRRLLETEEEVERKLSRKLGEIEDNVDRRMKKRMEELEDDVGKDVEKKLAAERERKKSSKEGLKKIKHHALLRKMALEELKKSEMLKQRAQAAPEASAEPAGKTAGFVMRDSPSANALMVQKSEELQPIASKSKEQRMQELTKQLAMLNESFSKGLLSKEAFEEQSLKVRQELEKI